MFKNLFSFQKSFKFFDTLQSCIVQKLEVSLDILFFISTF